MAPGSCAPRSGRHLGQPPERLFCANGSNEVLQTLLLTYGGHGRRAAMFEPTYALHAHIARITGTEVVAGERRADFSIDVDAARALIAEQQPTIVFVCSPNNPTGTVEPAATIEALLDATDGLVVVDEAYGEFAPRSALDLVRDDGRLVVVRTYSKVWSLAALRLGFAVAPPWVVEQLEKVVLPYHLAVATQIAGRVALELADEMNDRVARLVEERERLVRGAREVSSASPCSRRARTSCCSGCTATVTRSGRSSSARRARARLLELAAPRGLPARHGRHARGERRVPRRAPRVGPRGGRLMARSSHQHRETKETTVDLALEIDGGGSATASTGIPFFDHMLEQLGKHGGFDLRIEATGDLEVDLHHTVEDVGIVLGTAFKEALGDKAGVRRFASALVPLDEALVQVALDLSGRPFLVYEVDPVAEWIGTFDPQLAEEFWRAFAFAAGITLHVRSLAGRNGHHVIEASFKGVARSLRDAVKIEGTGVPSTKGSL